MLKHPLIAFFKLIRIQNLLIIAMTQYSIKYYIFAPINPFSQFTPTLFFVSILSTTLIAAAGYIINDYFDVKTDRINRPETVVIDVVIKRRWAMVLHIVFNGVGLLLGIYLALKCHHVSLVLFQLVSIILLWFYSTHFKKQLLVGNMVVSLLTAIIPVMPMVYDYYLAGEIDPFIIQTFSHLIRNLIIITLAYALFAFLASMIREIVKDMEDYQGDKQTGCNTMPIVWGMITSKVVTFFLIVITIGLLILACLKFSIEKECLAIYYILGLLVLPFILLLVKITRANTSKDFKMASLLLKFIMLFGISFTLVIKHIYEFY